MIGIGIIGFGNVGQGIYNILKDKGEFISQRLGTSISIQKICVRSIEKYKHLVVSESILTTQINDVIANPNIHIVIEVIGGEYPAYDYITTALSHKKHVVTANKEVVSKHKKHFFRLFIYFKL